MRIGVNALYLIPGGVGGTEIYLRGLLGGLAAVDAWNSYVVFTNRETGPDLAPEAPNFRLAPQPVRAAFRPGRMAWEQVVLPGQVMRHRLDVLLNPGFTAPVAAPCPQVTVFHDLQHKRHPEFFRWFDLPFWRLLLWASARRSRRLIAVSEATRDDLVRYYRLRPERIDVVLHGVDERLFNLSRAPEPFVLCVSTLHPHKNLEALLEAFARLRRTRPGLRLVLAGMRGFHAEAVERRVAELGLADAVRITGWIAREDLYELYRRAWAFVYPSRFEGFGMPVLEAMAVGIPTACSSIRPLRELAGDAALWFDPGDTEAMVRALETVVSDDAARDRLAAAGPRRAAAYRWERAAAMTLAALESAAGLSRDSGASG